MLEVKNLYLSYTKEYFTLNNINLSVSEGETVILLGEKESGKSSLIRILAGLESATKGEVLLKDKPISLNRFKNEIKMGYLSSFGAFINRKTVRKNLEYVLKIRGFSKEDIINKVNAAIMVNKLENIADMPIKSLSNYDKLRVAIVRLSLRPLEYIIIDDIFENVSEEEGEKLAGLINELLHKNKKATVIIAVNSKKMADNFKGKVVKLKYGSIVEE